MKIDVHSALKFLISIQMGAFRREKGENKRRKKSAPLISMMLYTSNSVVTLISKMIIQKRKKKYWRLVFISRRVYIKRA